MPDANKNEQKLQGFPFSIEHFLKAVDDSSRRSRNILLILAFSSLLVLMALINSVMPQYNWYKSKLELNKTVLNFVIFGQEYFTDTPKSKQSDSFPPLNRLSQFILINEQDNNGQILDTISKSKIANYDKEYPLNNLLLKNPKLVPIYGEDYETRNKKYKQIAHAIEYIRNHDIYESISIREIVNKLEDAKIEHLDLIRVPILGISFHVNYLGVYAGAVLATLYILLYFSLIREMGNLTIAFKRGWNELAHHHYYLYEYVSMLQVLSFPKELFSITKSRNLTYRLFSFVGIYLPAVVYLFVFLYDIRTFSIGYETNPVLTIFTLLSNSVCMLLVSIFAYRVWRTWKRMNLLWDNQPYSLKIEYILESIGEDTPRELIHLTERKLKIKDKQSVHFLWANILKEELSRGKTKQITIRKAFTILNKFIDKSLNADFPNPEAESDSKFANYWPSFKDWYKKFGKKNLNSEFRTSFRDMIRSIKDKSETEIDNL